MSAAVFALTFCTVKLCFASAMAIVCGWQPMPDGSPSYECVVQLEPELLNSLRNGDSIPLSVEVPAHVRPISRIRIAVGNGELPQRMLAAEFKPWPTDEKKSRDGVVETQFTTSTNDGYGIQRAVNQQIAPASEYLSNAQNNFARTLQNGGQAVRDAAAQATQDILPPDPGRSINNAIDRAGQQLGKNLQTVGETVQEDIRQMFSAEPGASTSAILPQATSGAPLNGPQQQILPVDQNAVGNSRRRLDQPIGSNPTNDWQSSAAAGANASMPANSNSSRGTFSAPWPEVQAPQTPVAAEANVGTSGGDRYGGASLPSSSNGSILPQNNGPVINRNDRYGSAAQSQPNGFVTADNRSVPATNNQSGNSAGPTFPPFEPSAGVERSPITPTPQSQVSNSPEIRRDMLNQPANAEIQGANGLPIGQQVIANPQASSTSLHTTPPTSAASSFGWPQTTPSHPQTTVPSAGTPGPVFPLLLSWVLLSGSGAGNLYLFWSYLDVRNKYRDLVDEASRRISGRRIRD